MLKTFRNRSNTNWERTDELLSAYLDGMLPMQERAALEARLLQEPALLARLEGLRLTVSVLRDLPEVETPRNFILSPSMVAQPRVAPRPRQRRIWTVFGWATAAAALMFLLVFGGDVFFVAPSLRPQPADFIAGESQTLVLTPGLRAIPSSTVMPEVAPVEAEATAELQLEKEAVAEQALSDGVEVEVAVEDEIAVKVPPATEATRGMVGAAAPTIGDGTAAADTDASENLSEFEARTTEEGGMTLAQATPVSESGPAPSGEVADATAVEEAVTIAPEPSPAEVTEGAPQFVSPLARTEVEESDTEPEILPERATTPEAVAVAPLTALAPALDSELVAKSAPFWLRLLEVGLGLAVVVLGTTTLMLRRRKV